MINFVDLTLVHCLCLTNYQKDALLKNELSTAVKIRSKQLNYGGKVEKFAFHDHFGKGRFQEKC